jgi:hypothetical protein
MRFLNWLLSCIAPRRSIKQVHDPVFGVVVLMTSRVWDGSVLIPSLSTEIAIRIFDATESGPTHWQRQRFLELLERIGSLRLAMEKPLRDTYGEIRTEWRLSSRPITTPKDIWSIATLRRIEIFGEHTASGADFVFCHEIDWDNPDHELNVRVTSWEVQEVGMEG